MTIREERNPRFWRAIVADPFVACGALMDGEPEASIDAVVASDQVVPLASVNGGFLFIKRDHIGRAWELHSMFTREGTGREAMFAAVEAFNTMFARGMQILFTYEVDGNARSRPPKGFGFEPAGEFAPALGRMLRSWVLTQAAWEGRPSRLGVN